MNIRPLPDLAPLDPAHRSDCVSSPAALALLERIVATPRTAGPTPAPAGPTPGRAPRRSPQLASALLATSAAAALVIAAGAVVVTQDAGSQRPQGDPSITAPSSSATPVQVVLAAARTTAAVASLRLSGTWTSQGLTSSFIGEVDGQRARQVITSDDGGTATYIQDGTDQWYLADGLVARESTYPMAPFPQAAAAVVTAVTELGAMQDLGLETVDGASAQHYRVTVGDRERAALAALPAGERGWFGLEDTTAVSAVDIWVADGLIVKTAVQGALRPDDRFEAVFTDFGAGITIDVPQQESRPLD